MRKTAALLTLAILGASQPSAAQTINFENAYGDGPAQCFFPAHGTLTTLYSGQGVTFNGNGTVLGECGNWTTGPAHSGTDFVGYNVYAPNSFPSEDLTFSAPHSFFDVFVGSASTLTYDVLLGGVSQFSGTGSLDPSQWTEFSYIGAYDEVRLSSDEFMQLDDLSFNEAQTAPEPASLALLATGFVGLGVVRRRRR